MMRVVVLPAAMGKWHGWLYIDDEEVFSTRGPRPGCVVRDLINWAHYHLMPPTERVVLEITEYE
jgi:hypothetical protein